MNRIAVGILVGGALGILDGLTAWFTPEAPGIVGIVVGSTIKGLIAGAIIGVFARKVSSLGWTLAFGPSWRVARVRHRPHGGQVLSGDHPARQPVGLLTGYATIRYGRAPSPVAPTHM